MNTIQLNPGFPEDASVLLGTNTANGASTGFDIFDLVELDVDFPALPAVLADCPVTYEELSAFLKEEIPEGGPIAPLQFVRTALAFGERYWVWEGVEPVSGCRGYATVSAGNSIEIGFDINWEGLTPAQFIVGVHHQII